MNVTILVYGASGVGKTVLLGSAHGDERICPLLILDFEGGTMSIESKVREIFLEHDDESLVLGSEGFEPGVIDFIRIREWSQFQAVYEQLWNGLDKTYQSVAIDSLSETNYLNLRSAVEYGITQRSTHDPDIPEMGDYNRSAVQMRRLVRAFRDLECNVFFTALPKEEKNPKTQRMELRPSFTGKLTQELPGLVGIVGYLTVDVDDEGRHRAIYVQPYGDFYAKDRTEDGRLGESITDPTLPQIFDLIEGKEQLL